MRPPEIGNSTEEERRQYIKNTFRCIADCDMCGLCTVFHGKDPEVAYVDYISGKRDYLDVSKDYTTLQLFHKKNIVQDFLMYNEFDPKHYKGK